LLQLQRFGSHKKKQNRGYKTRFTGALRQTPLGEFTALRRPIAVFKGSTSQQRRNGRVDRAKGKGRRMETGKGMERKWRR